jgi:hypothetical protein
MGWLAQWDRLDRINPLVLLWINAAIASLVALAHGGALLLVRLGKAAEFADEIYTAYLSVPTALFALLISIVAIVKPQNRVWVLRVHTVLLTALAIGMIYFAVDVVVRGVPPTTKFSWNPVLFAFLLAYPVYLAIRMFAPDGVRQSSGLRFAPAWAIAVSAVLSVLVFWRVFASAT